MRTHVYVVFPDKYDSTIVFLLVVFQVSECLKCCSITTHDFVLNSSMGPSQVDRL